MDYGLWLQKGKKTKHFQLVYPAACVQHIQHWCHLILKSVICSFPNVVRLVFWEREATDAEDFS